jgi:two-component system nitrate/nitrite response regulator NarL
MAAKVIHRAQPTVTVPEVSPATQALIRKLVARMDPPAAAPSGKAVEDTDSRQVIFNAEVDGVRCLLVKTPASDARSISLSPREREIARMIAKGYPNKTIAAVLDISVWTVCTHLRRIFAKMGVTSRTAMVSRMMTAGLLQ